MADLERKLRAATVGPTRQRPAASSRTGCARNGPTTAVDQHHPAQYEDIDRYDLTRGVPVAVPARHVLVLLLDLKLADHAEERVRVTLEVVALSRREVDRHEDFLTRELRERGHRRQVRHTGV